MTKYVAFDVHQATTVASVRGENGRVLARTILPTEEPAIVEFFRRMRGAAFAVRGQPGRDVVCEAEDVGLAIREPHGLTFLSGER
jgi:hypothetical protein